MRFPFVKSDLLWLSNRPKACFTRLYSALLYFTLLRFPFVKSDLLSLSNRAKAHDGNYDLSRYRPPLQVLLDMCPHSFTRLFSALLYSGFRLSMPFRETGRLCGYICVLILLYMCPHIAVYVSSYCCICVLMLLYMCPHTAICVSTF
jgi:hypothetical protein